MCYNFKSYTGGVLSDPRVGEVQRPTCSRHFQKISGYHDNIFSQLGHGNMQNIGVLFIHLTPLW